MLREWKEHAQRVLHHGALIDPRGHATRELLNAGFTIDYAQQNIIDAPSRKLNYRFMVAEWLWMSFGRSDVETLAAYNSIMRQYSDDGVFLTGAYGPHIKAGAGRALARLEADRVSRQAVIQIPRPRVMTKDEPCTLSFQLLDRADRLNMIVTMRSSDLWLGLPYDVFSFSMLLNCYAGELGREPGWLTINAGSAHVYERDLPAVKALILDYPHSDLWSPALPGMPPAWLEDVLIHRDRASIQAREEDQDWLAYAEVLLSKSSVEARDHLRALHVAHFGGGH